MGNSIQTPEYAFCDCDVKNYFDKEIINSKPVSMNSDSSFNLEETDDKKSMMGGSIPKFKNTSSYMYGYMQIRAYTYIFILKPNRCLEGFWRGICRRFLAAV